MGREGKSSRVQCACHSWHSTSYKCDQSIMLVHRRLSSIQSYIRLYQGTNICGVAWWGGINCELVAGLQFPAFFTILMVLHISHYKKDMHLNGELDIELSSHR
jgi:hypothetical protein